MRLFPKENLGRERDVCPQSVTSTAEETAENRAHAPALRGRLVDGGFMPFTDGPDCLSRVYHSEDLPDSGPGTVGFVFLSVCGQRAGTDPRGDPLG